MGKKVYGLVGYPLGHSFSRGYFNQKFADEHIDAEYVNFEIAEINRFTDIIDSQPNLAGLNVTIPYKQQVIEYLDGLDETAANIGAVNVIKVIRNERGDIVRLCGYNSDVIGFVNSIKPLLKHTHRRALILGTGGASKAVRYGLESLGVATTFVSRTPQAGMLSYSQLHQQPQLLNEYTVIVNTTPVGMHPHIDSYPDLPYEALTPAHLCFDLVYNPEVTMFMKKSAERGAVTVNGHDMLIGQAIAAYDIWNQ